jgi:hypothetical protein
MLHIIYRLCNKDNDKPRPAFYSKPRCLLSLLGALPHIQDYSLTFVCDGLVDWFTPDSINHAAKIITLHDAGNSGSFMKAFDICEQYDDCDLIYFVEDDYLHLPLSLLKLQECAECIPAADYLSLYDHPVRYYPADAEGADLRVQSPGVMLSRSHHWQVIESACMTFAARAKALRADRIVFERYVGNSRVPRDRELFRHLQGLGDHSNYANKRILVGSIPSLATHCEEPWLAPTIDWAAFARTIEV